MWTEAHMKFLGGAEWLRQFSLERQEASGLHADCRSGAGSAVSEACSPRPLAPPGLLVSVLPGEFPSLLPAKPRSPLSLDHQNKKPQR